MGENAQPAEQTGHLTPLRSDPRPLYVRAEEAIRGLITQRALGPGDRLPSEIRLARMLGISRPTIREALRHLQLNGQVRRVHGLGTIVARPVSEIVAGLETLESLESLAARQGWSCGTVEVTLTRDALDADEAEQLDRPAGSVATRVTRVKTRDGVRIAFMESVVPYDVLAPEEFGEQFSTSIIDMFGERNAPLLHHAVAHVRIHEAGPEISESLGLHSRALLLLLEEIFYDPAGRPFCLNRNWFVPGTVRLDLVRSPP